MDKHHACRAASAPMNDSCEAPFLHAAITRAREAAVVVGSEAAIRTALQGTQGDVRLTSLHARLAAAAARLGLPAYVRFLFPLSSSCTGTFTWCVNHQQAHRGCTT